MINRTLANNIEQVGLVVEIDKDKLKGNSCNVLSWPVFRLWINKSNKLTVRTRGAQKSFENWTNLQDFKNILKGFEII